MSPISGASSQGSGSEGGGDPASSVEMPGTWCRYQKASCAWAVESLRLREPPARQGGRGFHGTNLSRNRHVGITVVPFDIQEDDARDRKSVVEGKSVEVRLDTGGARKIK